MPTKRVADTAGQAFNDEPIVQVGEETDEPRVEIDLPPDGTTVELPAEPADEPTASAPAPGFSSEQTAAIARLRRLGSRRVALRAELEAVDRELLDDAIIGAFKLAVPKRVIARESQVVRQTVYNVIERADG